MILAYIDPGFGALLWQMIVAVFVGFLFYLKQTRRWIVGVIVDVFRKMFGRSQKLSDTVAEIPVKETIKAKL
ncbi:MAG: hypothetical protein ABSD77_05335 [Verrucomicrobiota bacterium]|jgi:hypothetical protein